MGAPSGDMVAVTPERLTQTRRALGRGLTRWREAAGLTQVVFAKRMAHSRSVVANVEVGRQNIPRAFWQRADGELRAGGALLAAFDELAALVAAYRVQAARAAEGQRLRGNGRPAVAVLAQPWPAAAAGPGGCPVVARWSGRETLALREALRLSLRAFAERLGVATATVASWEDRRRPVPPSLAMQAVLDAALRLADPDARTRFGMIMSLSGAVPDAVAGTPAAAGAGECASVTALRRGVPVRAAS